MNEDERIRHMSEAQRQRLLQDREDIIARVGWMVQAVGGDPNAPPFSYTIGLHDKGLPELIVVGMADRNAMLLLNEVGTLLVADPTRRGKVDSPRWSHQYFLLDADQETVAGSYAFGAANRSHGTAKYVQVVLPDRFGKFPWDRECSPHFKALFPVLGPICND